MSISPIETPTIDIDDLVLEDDTPVDNFFSAKLQGVGCVIDTPYNWITCASV